MSSFVAEKHLGFVDRVTATQVLGWAIELDAPRRAARLDVVIDGEVVETIQCGHRRDDLRESGLPSARAGFVYDIPVRFLDDAQHRIAFRFRSGTPIRFTNRLGQYVDEWHFVAGRDAVYEGFVDGLSDGGAINGWIFRTDLDSGERVGGNQVLVLCDGAQIGQFTADRYRADVGAAHKCDPYCGFAYSPPGQYRTGRIHEFRFLVLPDRIELTNSPLTTSFLPNEANAILQELYDQVEHLATQTWLIKNKLRGLLPVEECALTEYDAWARRYFAALRARVLAAKARRPAPAAGRRPAAPLVSVICPTYKPHLPHFIAAVDSVRAQTYADWELIIVDDGSRSAELTACIKSLERADRRIRALHRARNQGISAATNAGIEAARGGYVALFDHDDLLVDVALDVMVDAASTTGARLLYSDEDKVDGRGTFSEVHLKTDWNYRLLLTNNYVCHLLMVERALLQKAGRLRSAYDGAQDHDLVLRLSEIADPTEIRHVPEILYHWRKTPASTAMSESSKSYAAKAGIGCITDHLKRRGMKPAVTQVEDMMCFQIDWRLKAEPKVCIVIPFKDQVDLTSRCLRAILSLTDYRNFEVLLVDNWSESEEARTFCAEVSNIQGIRVLHVPEPFNFSRLNNLATRRSDAAWYMFMNNDLFVTQRNWLRILVDEALATPRVGAVGGKFIYPNQTVQHAGVILGVGGVADHAHRGLKATDRGYMARAVVAQELSAVTAAGMLCSAEAFAEVGGFDEEHLLVAFNDVDLCLKMRRAGWRIVWTPVFLAEHHESVSRGNDMSATHQARFFYECQTMQERWGPVIAADPYYNRNFSRSSGLFRVLSREPLEERPAARPRRLNGEAG